MGARISKFNVKRTPRNVYEDISQSMLQKRYKFTAQQLYTKKRGMDSTFCREKQKGLPRTWLFFEGMTQLRSGVWPVGFKCGSVKDGTFLFSFLPCRMSPPFHKIIPWFVICLVGRWSLNHLATWPRGAWGDCSWSRKWRHSCGGDTTGSWSWACAEEVSGWVLFLVLLVLGRFSIMFHACFLIFTVCCRVGWQFWRSISWRGSWGNTEVFWKKSC